MGDGLGLGGQGGGAAVMGEVYRTSVLGSNGGGAVERDADAGAGDGVRWRCRPRPHPWAAETSGAPSANSVVGKEALRRYNPQQAVRGGGPQKPTFGDHERLLLCGRLSTFSKIYLSCSTGPY